MKSFINFLTILRIFLAPFIFLLIVFSNNYFLALLLFFIAGLTDYYDGVLARKYQLTSIIGEILDPSADKILIVFCLIGLSINLHSTLVAFLGSIIISREVWVAALRDFNSKKGNTSATKVTFLAKIKTTIQMITIIFYIISLHLNIMLMLPIADSLLILSTIITLYTGFQYTYYTFNQRN